MRGAAYHRLRGWSRDEDCPGCALRALCRSAQAGQVATPNRTQWLRWPEARAKVCSAEEAESRAGSCADRRRRSNATFAHAAGRLRSIADLGPGPPVLTPMVGSFALDPQRQTESR